MIEQASERAREPADAAPAPSAWALWLGLTWVALLVLGALATVGDLEDLRLTLDLPRHFAPGT